jgi:hypothetical protein
MGSVARAPVVELLTVAALLGAAACAHGSMRGSPSDVRVPDASAVTWIEPGATYAGTAGTPDPDIRGMLAPVRFRFHGEGGQRVRFRLQSTVEDAFGRGLALYRVDGGARLDVENADQRDGSTLSSALLPATGDYRVELSTGNTSSGRNDFRIEFLPSGSPVPDLEEDVPHRGQLTSRDRRDFDDEPSDLLRFHVGDEDRKLRFVVTAPGFEPQLEVYEDLASLPEVGARGELTATLTGEVYLRVASASGQRGAYEIVVQDARAYEMARMPVLELGTTITVPIVPEWRFAEFKVRGEVGVPYVIHAESKDFDVELILHNNMPPARLAGMTDDNGAGGTDALLVFKFPDPEEWVIRVTEAGDGSTPAGELALSFYTVEDVDDDDERVTDDAADTLEAIRRHVAASAAATWTIDLEPSGRFVRRDAADSYEEDFLLRDVTEVAYEYVADWAKPHVVRVKLTENAETKYRYGDGAWTISGDKAVTFAFTNQAAADAVVVALRRLVAAR